MTDGVLNPGLQGATRARQVTCCAMQRGAGLLVAGFSDGAFAIHEMPECVPLHALSIAGGGALGGGVTSVALDAAGEWLALGCAHRAQLVVWEWRSEQYVLRQQGHDAESGGASCAAWSPDGRVLASGGDDARVKARARTPRRAPRDPSGPFSRGDES